MGRVVVVPLAVQAAVVRVHVVVYKEQDELDWILAQLTTQSDAVWVGEQLDSDVDVVSEVPSDVVVNVSVEDDLASGVSDSGGEGSGELLMTGGESQPPSKAPNTLKQGI